MFQQRAIDEYISEVSRRRYLSDLDAVRRFFSSDRVVFEDGELSDAMIEPLLRVWVARRHTPDAESSDPEPAPVPGSAELGLDAFEDDDYADSGSDSEDLLRAPAQSVGLAVNRRLPFEDDAADLVPPPPGVAPSTPKSRVVEVPDSTVRRNRAAAFQSSLALAVGVGAVESTIGKSSRRPRALQVDKEQQDVGYGSRDRDCASGLRYTNTLFDSSSLSRLSQRDIEVGVVRQACICYTTLFTRAYPFDILKNDCL